MHDCIGKVCQFLSDEEARSKHRKVLDRAHEIRKKHTDLATAPAEVTSEVRQLLDHTRQLSEHIETGAGKVNGVPAPVDGPSACLALPGKVRKTGGSSWAQSWIKGQQGKSLLAPNTIPVSVPLRADVVRDAEPVLALRQVIPFESNTTGHYAFLRQTERLHAARTVAKGTRKPTSQYTVERVDGRVKTIAHLSEPIDRADLQDASTLAQFL